MADDLPTITTLDELGELLGERTDLYIRWSKGPDVDEGGQSRDDLTGIPLPGLSANPLAVEPWWGDRPVRTWAARRLYDYRHLQERRGPGVRPWILQGHEIARGPDNEPLVECEKAIAWVADDVVTAAEDEVARHSDEWGPLDREGHPTR